MKTMTTFLRLLGITIISRIAVLLPASGQVNINSLGTPYTQNFNILAGAGTNIIWSDNSTIPGWYSNKTTYDADSGFSSVAGLFSYGLSPGFDRALGSSASAIQWVGFAVKMVNKTGTAITSFNISYVGEQWRCANTLQQLLDFQYKINAAGITDVSWIDVNPLDFLSLQTCPDSSLRDGNQPANRANIVFTLNVTLNINDTIWFRWVDNDDFNADHGLGIDDLSITANGCSGPTTSNSVSNVTCNGLCNGSVTTSPTGGTPPYTYNWNIGATNPAIISLCPGSYTVTVTDNVGCTATATSNVNQPAVLVTSSSKSDVTCFGLCNGSASTTPSGGISPYTYSWSGGQTNANITNLCAGGYSVTVTDINGCTTSSSVTVTQPSVLIVTANSTNVSCNGGNNGTATASPSGGTPPYSYSWNTAPVQTTVSATGLPAGTYTVTVTDNKGCTVSNNANVNEPAVLAAATGVFNASCYGVCDGTMWANTTGGTPPYTFNWTGGCIYDTCNFVCAGTYSVNITDFNNCTTSANATITEPADISISQSFTDPTCNGANNGTATVAVSGGVPPYNYSWSNGKTSSTATGLGAGNYDVTVTDANACSKELKHIAVIGTATNSIGGVGTLTISKPTGTQKGDVMVAAIGQYSNASSVSAPPGWTVLWMFNFSGCANYGVSFCAYKVAGPSEPPSYGFSYNGNDGLAGGITTFRGINPITPVGEYSSANTVSASITTPGRNTTLRSEMYVGVFNSFNGMTLPGSMVQQFQVSALMGTALGTESIPATGATGGRTVNTGSSNCVGSGSLTLMPLNSITLINPPPLVANAGIDHTICQGGNTAIGGSPTATGGISPYTFSWNTSSGLNDSTFANPTASPAISRYYSVSVIDNNACVKSDTMWVIVNPSPSVTVSKTDVSCFGGTNGTATANVTGGTSPYIYIWDDPAPAQSTQTATGLSAGTYNVTVTDALSCSKVSGTNVNEQPALSLSMSSGSVTCNGGNNGTASVTVSGGLSPYSYLWSNSAVTQNITGLISNLYTVTVTDANGCTGTNNIFVNQPTALGATVTSVFFVTCNGLNNGGGTVSAFGGTAPYSYLWPSSQTTPSDTMLYAGTYPVTVTDANTCTYIRNVVINEPPVLTTTIYPTNVLCNGDSTGMLEVITNGGTTPYTFNWSNPVTLYSWIDWTDVVYQSPAGTYIVTVTDDKGCTATDTATVNQPALLIADAGTDKTICQGSSIAIGGSPSATGGVSPYAFSWNPSAGLDNPAVANPNANPASTTSYALSVTDNNGCVKSDSAYVFVNNPAFASAGVDATICQNNTYTLSGSRGGSATSSTWISSGTGSFDNAIILSATYTPSGADIAGGTVTLTLNTDDPAGPCPAASDAMVLTINQAATVSAGTDDVICQDSTYTLFGSRGGSATSSSWISSGTGTFNDASLLTAIYTPSGADVSAGSVTLTITTNDPDGGGPCTSASDAMALTIDAASTAPAGASASVNPVCTGNMTTLTVSGGSLGSGSGWVWYSGSCGGTPEGTGPSLNVWPTVTTTYFVRAEGPCNFTSCAPVIVNVDQIPTSPSAGPDQDLCNVTTTVLSGNTPIVGTGLWEILSGVATIVTPTSPTSSVTGLVIGTSVLLRWSISNGSCVAINDNMYINVYDIATANAGVDAAICAGNTFALSGNIGGNASSSTWSSSGTGSFDNPSILNAVYTPSGGDIASGNVTLTLATDDPAGPCTAAGDAMVLTINANPSVTISKTDVSCNGGADGTATAFPSGGTSPYVYVWDDPAPAQSTQTATGLNSGNFNVSVTDANSCSGTGTITIGEPALLVVSAGSSNASCGNSDGSATANASGGTGSYSYLWTGGQTSSTATGLAAGIYSVTVTDGNSCTATTTATVNNTGGPTASISSSANVTCNGLCNGTADAGVTGGTPPYNYLWSTGGQTTTTATGLCAGTHTVTVTDANTCNGITNVTITEPSVLTVTLSTVINVTCSGGNNGSATVAANGGISPYGFVWSTAVDSSATAINLPAGTFDVTVTDMNGCTVQTSATVTEPVSLYATGNSVSATCGNANGQASALTSGGTPPYSYNWSSGGTLSTEINLYAGNYIVTVTDSNGCQISNTVNVPDGGGAVTVTVVSITNENCGQSDGTITISVSGGSSPYSYIWSNSATTSSLTGVSVGVYNVTITENGGCTGTNGGTINAAGGPSVTATATDATCGTSNGSVSSTISGGTAPFNYIWSNTATTANISALVAGNYTVTVTDVNNCTATATATINNISGPSVATTATNATCYGCNDGTATANPSGGVSPYGYLWNSSPVQNTQVAAGLIAGTYSVTVNDANGCTVTGSATVTEPPPVNVVASVTANNTSCNGLCNGSASASAVGGTLPYTYSWSNGSTANAVSGLCAGSYSVIVQDNSGGADTVSFAVSEPALLSASVAGTNISSCGMQDGLVDLTVTGGTSPYNFNWSNGSVTEDITNISGGYYYVVVTDANSCTITASVTVTAPPAIALSTSVTDASACNASDGAVDLTVTGGVAPFTFVWSGGATTEDITGVPSGNHSATVIDAVNCHASISALVNEPAAYTLSFVSTNVLCDQNCDGSILVSTTGGVAPFTYLWDDNLQQNTSLATGLCAGAYSVTVRDANGCMVTGSADVLSPSPLALTMSSVNTTVCGGTDGTASVAVSGGTPPYEFNWSNGSTLSAAINLPGGTHYVTVLDSNNCVAYGTANISDASGPVISIVYVVDVACAGIASGAINISVTGGLAPYTYLWSNARTTQDLNAISGGDYEVQVTDASGCKASQTITVTAPPALTVSVTAVNSSCGSADGSATLNVSGGLAPYSYQWSVFSSASSLSGLAAGSYGYTVTDANYCEKTGFAAVSDNGGPVVAVDSINHIGCGDSLTGAIYISVSGGTAPYNYSWSNSETTEDIETLAMGRYFLTVTDTNGCMSAFNDTIMEDPPITDPICLVTVDSTGFNRIVWTKAGIHIAFYNIYRETGNSGNFMQLGTVNYADESSFLDTFSNPGAKSWRYKLGVVDSCGNESAFLSPMHKTIYLNVYQAGPGVVLVWDPYYGFYYNDIVIYRGTAPDSLFPLDTIPVGGNSYFDANPPQSILIYYNIAAIHPTGCTALKIKTYNASKSNTASLQAPVKTKLAAPQSLMVNIYPNPAKDKVTIVATGYEKENPKLEIYNVIGKLLYSKTITGKSSLTIDVTGWRTGIYSIRLIGENDAMVRKFVIER